MATSSGSALLFPSLLAIFMWLALLADARYPLETREQAFSNTLRPEQSHKDVAEKPDFGDPNSYEHTLRLPSEKDDSISIEISQRQPNDAYFQPEPVQGHRFESERGKSHMDVRGSTSGRFPLGGVRPFRYGRPGGSDHCERLPFLMRRGDYGRHQFPRRMGPDSIPSHVHFHGEIGAFNVFPTHSEPAEFRPEIAKFEHGFQPADLKQSDPYHATVYEDGIPEKHINGVLPREPPALTSHEEKGEDPDVHWMGGLKSLFNRP